MKSSKRKRERGKPNHSKLVEGSSDTGSFPMVEGESPISYPLGKQLQMPPFLLSQQYDYFTEEENQGKLSRKLMDERYSPTSSFTYLNEKQESMHEKQESMRYPNSIRNPTYCFSSPFNVENKEETFIAKNNGYVIDSPSLSSVGTNSEMISIPFLNLNENKNSEMNPSQSFFSKDPPDNDSFVPYKVGERVLLPGGVISTDIYFTVPLIWTTEKTYKYIEKFKKYLPNDKASEMKDSFSSAKDRNLNDRNGKEILESETELEYQTESETESNSESNSESEQESITMTNIKTSIIQEGVKVKNKKIKQGNGNRQNHRRTPDTLLRKKEEEETITIFVREYILAKHEKSYSFPYLLYLQGGPGLASPRISSINSGWMRRALKTFRVLLLDQRGTGKSSPISMQTLSSTIFTPKEQFSILLNYRADSIIRDCEAIRLAYLTRVTNVSDSAVNSSMFMSNIETNLPHEKKEDTVNGNRETYKFEPRRIKKLNEKQRNGNNISTNLSDYRKDNACYFYTTQKWTVLGQSYGGFVLLSYLSTYPNALAACLFTGGLPPLSTENYEEIYRRLYRRVLQQNLKYYNRYPEDIARVRKIVRYLHLRKRVPLPSGGYLTPNRFLQLGTFLGDSTGCEDLHFLIEDAFVEKRNNNRPRYQRKLSKTCLTLHRNDQHCSDEKNMNTAEAQIGQNKNGLPIEQVYSKREYSKRKLEEINGESLELTYKFLRSIEAAQQIYDTSPLYSILHEQIYCHGKHSPPPRWAAHRILSSDDEFRFIFDYKEKLSRCDTMGNIKSFNKLIEEEVDYYSYIERGTNKTNLLHLPIGYKHEHMHKFFYPKDSKRTLCQSYNKSADRSTSIDVKSKSTIDTIESKRIGRVSSHQSISSFDTLESCDSFCTFSNHCQCKLMAMKKNFTMDVSKHSYPMGSENRSLHSDTSPFEQGKNSGCGLNTKSKIDSSSIRAEPSSILKDCIFFTAEGTYPWMFDDYNGLQNFKDVANMFSNFKMCSNNKSQSLYDIDRLQHNTVPCAAIIYTSDMYVDSKYSIETASVIKNMYTWVTGEYNHGALNEHGYVILDKLLRGIYMHAS